MSVPYHGGALDKAIAEFGGERSNWLDLSTGINPHVYPLAATSMKALHRLPEQADLDHMLDAARQAYAIHEKLSIVAAPGTQALIELLPRLLPGKTATIVAPASGTYREHANCCEKAGRDLREVSDPDQVGDDEQLVILVRPNNPDGSVVARDAVLTLGRRLHGKGGHLIVDEAFCDCAPGDSLAGEASPGVIILKSFGKFFGLAGLRLGFAICEAGLADRISRCFGPWAISGPAIEAGIAAYGDGNWIATMRKQLAQESNELAVVLENSGLEIFGRNGLFVLAGHEHAEQIFRGLARRHVLVRPFPDKPRLLRFGLPETPAALNRLQLALSQVLDELQ